MQYTEPPRALETELKSRHQKSGSFSRTGQIIVKQNHSKWSLHPKTKGPQDLEITSLFS